MKLRFLAVLALPLAVACSKGSPGTPENTPTNEHKAAEAAQTAEKAPEKAPAAEQAPGAVKPTEGKVAVSITEEGFEPSKIEAEADKPLTLVFTRKVEKTCVTGVVFPDLDIKKDLPVGQPVEVTVTPKAGGTINFQCPMGMGKSTIVTLPQA